MSEATFTKHNPGRPGDWEAACLSWLEEAADSHGGVPVAGVADRQGGDLVLRRVSPGHATAQHAEDFGRRLAATHAAGAPAFGAGPDGWEGTGYQGPNGNLLDLPLQREESWGVFYARVLADLDRTAGGLSGTDRLLDRLTSGDFDDERPAARLHGDLWSGNVMWSPEGATLIDPSAHGGHGLTDLGFLTMFGAPHLDTVLDAYAEAASLQPGWRELLPLHRLQVLYLHSAVFGGGYTGETERTVRQVLSL